MMGNAGGRREQAPFRSCHSGTPSALGGNAGGERSLRAAGVPDYFFDGGGNHLYTGVENKPCSSLA
jgi:hypothetical protein